MPVRGERAGGEGDRGDSCGVDELEEEEEERLGESGKLGMGVAARLGDTTFGGEGSSELDRGELEGDAPSEPSDFSSNEL